MGFRSEFLAGQSCSESAFAHLARGFEPTRELLCELRKMLRQNLEAAVDRPGQNTDAALVSELKSHILAIELPEKPVPDDAQADEKRLAELGREIQSYCSCLGPQLCRIRWAAERLVSCQTFRSLSETMEPRFRHCLEYGVRQFDSREYGDALDNLTRVSLAVPGHYFVNQYLGLLSVEQDDPEGALKHFEAAVVCAEGERHKALALSHLSRCHYALNRSDCAADTARQAAELMPESGDRWYEYAWYSTLCGRSDIAVDALTKALQADWSYWTIAVMPHFETLQPKLSSAMSEIRARTAGEARRILDGIKAAVEAARAAGAAESLIRILPQVDRLEARYRQGNIFQYRDVIAEAAKLHDIVQSLARDTIRERLSFWRNQLRRAEAKRDKRVAQINEPVERLKDKQRHIRADYKPWEAGCATYALLWLPCIAPVVLFLTRQPWKDIYIVLLLLTAVIPFLLPPLVNKLKYVRAVEEPYRQLEGQIREVERQLQPVLAEAEREHSDQKISLQSEIQTLERLKCCLEPDQGK